MKGIFLKRIFKFGWESFRRNKEASAVSIFVIFLTILLISSLFLFQGVTHELISQVKEQVGISAYFSKEITENEINSVEQQLKENFSDIEISYISAEEALQRFKQAHQGESVYEEALEQVGGNPFQASLDISSDKQGQYEEMVDFLEGNFSSYLYKVDYVNRKHIIDQVFQFSRYFNGVGLGLSLVLIGLAGLISFNTIKMAIYARRREIQTMDLVGAPTAFVKGPFLVQGALYGLFGIVAVNLILLPLVFYFSPVLQARLPGFSLWGYLGGQWFWFILLQLAVGVGLGVLSTFLAVRRYVRH